MKPYRWHEAFPGIFVVVRRQFRPVLAEDVYVAIVSFPGPYRPPPAFVRTENQQRAYLLPVQRAVAGRMGVLEIVFRGLWEGNDRIAAAVLCHSRGTEMPQPCASCETQRRPFTACVSLEGFFRSCCSNCLVNWRRDCTYATRYAPEIDEDYTPPRPPAFVQQQSYRESQGEPPAHQPHPLQPSREAPVEDSAHVGNSLSLPPHSTQDHIGPKLQGNGTRQDPIDLTDLLNNTVLSLARLCE